MCQFCKGYFSYILYKVRLSHFQGLLNEGWKPYPGWGKIKRKESPWKISIQF